MTFDLKTDAFQRAVNKPLTHWTDEDFTPHVRSLRAACGKTVGIDDVPSHGLPPSCASCRKAYDDYQAMDVA